MLNERIKQAIAESGLKQEEFAMRTGIQIERLKNICAGKIKKLNAMEARNIKTAFGFHELWLMSGKGPVSLNESDKKIQSSFDDIRAATSDALELGLSEEQTQIMQELLFFFRRKEADKVRELLTKIGAGLTDFVLIPKHDVFASAGNGTVVSNESIVDYLAFKEVFIRTLGLDSRHLALIEVRGDSMTPTINNGDLVLLDTRCSEVKSEGVYAINLNGALLLKRLRIRITGVIEIVSDNELYGVEAISDEELNRLFIIGRVVWHGRKF